jgi:hypothetical protein
LLRLELAPPRSPGFDAVDPLTGRRYQIKARALLPGAATGQIGSIKQTGDWNAVLLVLMSPDFEPSAIYEAERADVIAALTKPGSKARNERGALSVTKFKAISRQVWPKSDAHGNGRQLG